MSSEPAGCDHSAASALPIFEPLWCQHRRQPHTQQNLTGLQVHPLYAPERHGSSYEVVNKSAGHLPTHAVWDGHQKCLFDDRLFSEGAIVEEAHHPVAGFERVTPSPSSITSPAASRPGVKGSALNWYLPSDVKVRKLDAADVDLVMRTRQVPASAGNIFQGQQGIDPIER